MKDYYDLPNDIALLQYLHDLLLDQEIDKAKMVLENELHHHGVWVD